jgi:hypothetical protein
LNCGMSKSKSPVRTVSTPDAFDKPAVVLVVRLFDEDRAFRRALGRTPNDLHAGWGCTGPRYGEA